MSTQDLPDLSADAEHASRRRRRGMFFIGLATAGAGFAMAIQGGVNYNFLVSEIGASGLKAGLLEATRETCGITALVLLALLAGLPQPYVASGMLALLGIGISLYGWVPDYTWVILVSLVWSQGLHVWMPMPSSMTFALAEKGRAGHRLGQIQKAGAAGAGIATILAVTLILLQGWNIIAINPLRDLYPLAGVAALLAAVACLGIPRDIKTPGPRLVFRRRYGLYYLMSFLEGWRKQVFLCFAAFFLVSRYNTSLLTVFLLMGACQLLGWLLSPRVGKLIDRIGERKVLVIYYTSMVAVFIGYALIPWTPALYVLFVVDGTFFMFAMAMTTYVNRIAPKSEHTPTLSAGVAMNHVGAVITPAISGLLYGIRPWCVFAAGSAAAIASILVALRVPRHVPADQHATALPAEEA